MKKILALYLLLACTSCGKPSENNVPGWFLNEKPNDERKIYGYGSEISKEDAVKSALVNASERLYVTVGSTTKTSESQTQIGQEFDMRKKIQTRSIIDFRDYKIENITQENGVFYTMVSVDRVAVIESQIENLKNWEKSVTKLVELGFLEKYEKSLQIQKTCVNVRKTAKILNTLGAGVENPSIRQCTAMENEITSGFGGKTASMDGSGTIVQALRLAVLKSGMIIASGVGDFKIKTTESQREAEAYGTFTTVLNSRVEITNNGITTSKNLICTGSSAVSKSIAEKNAIQDCIKKYPSFESILSI